MTPHLTVLPARPEGEEVDPPMERARKALIAAACLLEVEGDERQSENADRLPPLMENLRRRAGAGGGFLEVGLAEYMGWREVLIEADLARSMSESVTAYVERKGER